MELFYFVAHTHLFLGHMFIQTISKGRKKALKMEEKYSELTGKQLRTFQNNKTGQSSKNNNTQNNS